MSVKQVIVVRTDLNMRKGKLASQVAHASMKVLLDRGSAGYTWEQGRKHPVSFGTVEDEINPGEDAFLIGLTPKMREWVVGIFTKVVVGVGSEEELLALEEKVRGTTRIPFALIRDVGNTEFHGVPTYTALAIGPDDAERIDPITGHLKLI